MCFLEKNCVRSDMNNAPLAMRQQRGTKRSCQACEQKFYDLGRDPVVCPVCHASLALAEFENRRRADAGDHSDRRAFARRGKPEHLIVAGEMPASDLAESVTESADEVTSGPSDEDSVLEQEEADVPLDELADASRSDDENE